MVYSPESLVSSTLSFLTKVGPPEDLPHLSGDQHREALLPSRPALPRPSCLLPQPCPHSQALQLEQACSLSPLGKDSPLQNWLT